MSFALDYQGRIGAKKGFASFTRKAGLLGIAIALLAPETTQNAVANGDTRTISLYHAHRKDSISVTFRRNGSYDSAALKKLNYYLRDWRNDEQVRMDPRLFDVIWETQRMVGSHGKITVLSSYRSPRTNSMLRSRSRAVAKNSQHMFGRAMDMRFSGVNMHRVREAAMKLQRGGVGWYRSGFVHLDVGSVRAWPRMSYSQLARLFPDGKTVHIASNGRTLPGYDEARSLVASRNGSYVPTLAQVNQKGFLARLFGWGDSGDEADQAQARGQVARGPLGRSAGPSSEDNSAASFFRRDAARLAGRGNTQVATRIPAVRAQPKPAAKSANRAGLLNAQKPEPVSKPAPETETVSRTPAVPVPPRRPAETKIATLIQHAAGLNENSPVPVPPLRPGNLAVVAENAQPSAPLPPDSRGRLAALIGLNGAGAIGANRDLPAMITRGTAVAAHANAPDALAFASPSAATSDRTQAAGRRQLRRARVQRLSLRRSLPAAPAIARTIGVRAASQQQTTSTLIAARLDRSNFHILTRPVSLAQGGVNVVMGTALAPLRSAARFSREALIFAPQDPYRANFAVTRQAKAGNYQRFVSVR